MCSWDTEDFLHHYFSRVAVCVCTVLQSARHQARLCSHINALCSRRLIIATVIVFTAVPFSDRRKQAFWPHRQFKEYLIWYKRIAELKALFALWAGQNQHLFVWASLSLQHNIKVEPSNWNFTNVLLTPLLIRLGWHGDIFMRAIIKAHCGQELQCQKTPLHKAV